VGDPRVHFELVERKPKGLFAEGSSDGKPTETWAECSLNMGALFRMARRKQVSERVGE
jgi:hypothetical protein